MHVDRLNESLHLMAQVHSFFVCEISFMYHEQMPVWNDKHIRPLGKLLRICTCCNTWKEVCYRHVKDCWASCMETVIFLNKCYIVLDNMQIQKVSIMCTSQCVLVLAYFLHC